MISIEKEAIIKEARIRFPKDTKYHPVNSSTLSILTNIIYTATNNYAWYENTLCSGGNVYSNGVWAYVVIEKPEIINNYEIY